MYHFLVCCHKINIMVNLDIMVEKCLDLVKMWFLFLKTYVIYFSVLLILVGMLSKLFGVKINYCFNIHVMCLASSIRIVTARCSFIFIFWKVTNKSVWSVALTLLVFMLFIIKLHIYAA